MLRVTIDLIPFGLDKLKKTIGIMEIANTGSGTKTSGNYRFIVYKKNSKTAWKTGELLGFKRKRFLAWDLLFKCLENVLSERESVKTYDK